jgi:hypothetical protein
MFNTKQIAMVTQLRNYLFPKSQKQLHFFVDWVLVSFNFEIDIQTYCYQS